jgi:sugar transferase (PEP-CTERM/EpsH1 system associated)
MAEILLICHRIPYPPNKGEKIRAFQMIQNLKKLGHSVTCAFPITEQSDCTHALQLNTICDRIIHSDRLPSKTSKYSKSIKALFCDIPLTKTFGFSQELFDKLNADNTHYDVVIFFSGVSCYYKNAVNHKASICDFVDVDSYKWQEYANDSILPFSYIYHRESVLMAEFEKNIAQEVNLSLFVTENEKKLFLKQNHDTDFNNPIDYLECSVDITKFDPELKYPNPFLFEHKNNLNFIMTGAMDYKPNYDGAVFFINKILPYLQENSKQKIGFYCVGRSPIKELIQYHNPQKNIIITGSVDDVRPYMAYGFACIAPLFIGRGIQNKVLEAMAMGKTCFVSPNAFDGIDAVDNQHLILCSNIDEWQQKILYAIYNPETLKMIGKNAITHVTRRYHANTVQEKLNMILNAMVSSDLPPTHQKRAV